MSVSIRALSKAKHVKCNGYVDKKAGELCDHDEIASLPTGREGLKCGCYVAGRGGRSSYFEIDYLCYSDWMDELCRMLEVEREEVREKRQPHRRKPFVELIDFPNSSDGQAIGPKTSATQLRKAVA